MSPKDKQFNLRIDEKLGKEMDRVMELYNKYSGIKATKSSIIEAAITHGLKVIESKAQSMNESKLMKNRIVSYLESVIWKREELSKEYPDDSRNIQCVSELKEFVEFIRSLDNNDERLKTIEKFQPEDIDVYMPSETVSNAIFRFGFHRSGKGDYESFFTWMADTDTEEWEKFQNELAESQKSED